MLTGAQHHTLNQFAESLQTLGEDALIDTYHQAAEDYREAQIEGSDNLGRSHAQMLAAQLTMRARFPDYRARYQARYPANQPAR